MKGLKDQMCTCTNPLVPAALYTVPIACSTCCLIKARQTYYEFYPGKLTPNSPFFKGTKLIAMSKLFSVKKNSIHAFASHLLASSLFIAANTSDLADFISLTENLRDIQVGLIPYNSELESSEDDWRDSPRKTVSRNLCNNRICVDAANASSLSWNKNKCVVEIMT